MPATTATPLSVIPTSEKLQEKMNPRSALPNNYVFSSKGMILYHSIEVPGFVITFLEFQKQRCDLSKLSLMTHLQLLMENKFTYAWSSLCSFHFSNHYCKRTEQNRLSWLNCEAIRETNILHTPRSVHHCAVMLVRQQQQQRSQASL